MFFFTLRSSTKKKLPTNEEGLRELQVENAQLALPKTFDLPKLVITLQAPNNRLRYIELTPHFLPFKEKETAILGQNKESITDAVIEITSKMTIEDLNSVSGKVLLENRLKKEINLRLGEPLVKEIYFSQFIIQ